MRYSVEKSQEQCLVSVSHEQTMSKLLEKLSEYGTSQTRLSVDVFIVGSDLLLMSSSGINVYFLETIILKLSPRKYPSTVP